MFDCSVVFDTEFCCFLFKESTCGMDNSNSVSPLTLTFFLIYFSRFIVWGYLSHMDTISLVSQAVALCLIVLIFLRSSYVLELALRNRLDIAWRLQNEKKSLQKEIKQHGTILQNILPKDICIALMR